MNKKLLLLLILFLTAATAGCSLAPYRQSPAEAPPPDVYTPALADTKTVKQKIYAQHRAWKGTRYRLGGLSKRGIDCSGLVYATFRDQLGIELPRTTEYQAQTGQAIRRRDLRPGDLVFFKTGYKVRHVGIYLEDDKFFHASTKHGVTISGLNDYYWRDKYWHARRVDPDAYAVSAGK